MEIYLDNSSTTKPCSEAVNAATFSMKENWGNPSSLHRLGFNADRAVEEARQVVANSLFADKNEIFFTSCGTESNNTAIIGAANSLKKRGNRIVTTSIEHPSVLNTMRRLEDEGFEVIYLKPDQSGVISENDIFEAVNNKTILVSMMYVNNETGYILPVEVCKRAIKAASSPALLHCDAVQAYGKLPVKLKNSGIDLLSISGHKIHAPKGIGALYIRNGVHIKPYLSGGGQEKGMRSGTENVPFISALGAAVKALPDIKKQLEKTKELSDYTREILIKSGFVKINSKTDALPYILNISVPGYRSETLLHFLESRDIFVSSGSACSKGKGSYVLSEFGLSKDMVDSALRISFSRFNTKDDADKLLLALKEAVNTLRRSC